LGLGGDSQGYRNGLLFQNAALQQRKTRAELERAAELERLRQRAILEAQTGGLPIPTRAAAAAMNGTASPLYPSVPNDGRMVDPNNPRAVPVRELLTANPLNPQDYSPISASPLTQAISAATGFGPQASQSVPSTSKQQATRGPGPGTPPTSDQGRTSTGSLGIGLPPALSAYLMSAAPSTYATLAASR